MTKEADTFCILPWVSAVYAPNKMNLVCCRSFEEVTEYTLDAVNSKSHKHLREALGKGIQDPICSRCWFDEKAGIPSYRQDYNNIFNNIITTDAYDPPKLRFLEYTPNNVCNLACRMCNSLYSTRILAREKQIEKKIWGEDAHYTDWRELDLTHLQELKLMGGEPMYLREHLEMLEYLDTIGVLKGLCLTLITNCTHSISDEWKRVLDKIRKIHLVISVDAVGSVNEYIRQYSNWEEVDKNINEFVEYRKSKPAGKIFITMNCTVGLYNVNKTKELDTYAKEKNIDCYFNPLTFPEYQSLFNISEEHKKILLENKGVSEKLYHVLREPEKNVVPKQTFITMTDKTDAFYNKYLKDYNQEICELFYD